MAKVEVKCSISNCTFWGSGNQCNAETIQVDLDAHANFSYEMAVELGEFSHQDNAGTSAETCCKTFNPQK
ncbi:DUF1540 domain-containing protein [Bacillus sp. 2205SS5-2]|uniref:DUF1540 domain-containing protein n=1 Tax=Bacillus sp. 2205SS5-2 TaxID=3109031 RepID=UPI00300487A3